MYGLAVVGTNEFVLGFRLAGILKAVQSDEKDFLKTVRTVMDDKDVGILVVDDSLFSLLESSDIYDLEKSIRPVVISVSEKGSQDSLRRMIKKSIGVDLWKEE
jgi:V/A-type H+/Na+-transporting ATPase subunit F